MARVAVLCVLLGLPTQDPPVAVPDAEAQKKAEKVFREVFGADYAKKPAAERIAFAKKVLQQGIETRDEPASQYVMFREARDVAARAGDAATALRAVDEMAKRFQIDAPAAKLATLTLVTQEAKVPEAFKSAGEAWLKLAEEAGAGGDFQTADKSVAAAVVAAKKAKDVSLVSRAEAKSRELAEMKARQARVKKAREMLAATPADPAANLEVGQFECFTQGNWESGLPLLAKSSDEALRTLVEKDLANPKESADQIGIADAWWTRSEKESGLARQKMRERAAHWYGLAAQDASGLTRVKIDRRLAELGRIAAPTKGALAEGLIGWWRLDEGGGTRVEDGSGRQNHGSIGNGMEWGEGQQGKALRFAAKDSQVVVPDVEMLRIRGDITLALWFRVEARSPDWVRLIGKGTDRSRNYGLWVEHEPGKRILFQQGDDPRRMSLFASTTVVLGNWYHLAGTVQGSTASVFVNGRKEGTVTRPAEPPLPQDPLTFGNAGFHSALNGFLDDIRIYNRALGDEEIQKLASEK